jgi:transcriptional regulator with XRE-family HTH domain
MEGEEWASLIRAQLRRTRTAKNISQEEFGRRANYSASLVSAVETGTRPLDRPYATRADEVLETGGLFIGLLDMAEQLGAASWFLSWLEAERAAKQLRCYQPLLIPGLLQTEGYARAVIRCDDTLSDAEVERRLATRLDRQSILAGDDPAQLIAVIEEHVLRRADEAFRAVMCEQIEYLISLAQRPNVSVHILPDDVSVHAGLTGPEDVNQFEAVGSGIR